MKRKFDEKSFAGFQAGNSEDFDLLTKYFYETVKYSTRCLPAADPYKGTIINAVFLKAWQRREKFKSILILERWLRRVAYHDSITRHRRRATETKTLQGVQNHSETIEGGKDPKEDHEKLLQKLDTHLARLPAQSRKIVDLYYREKKSHSEIGCLYNISANAVAARLTRIRRRLKSQLGQAGLE